MASKQKIPSLVISDLYQKFKKNAGGGPNSPSTSTQYQSFSYNRKNIPKIAIASTKEVGEDDLDKLRESKSKGTNTGGSTKESKVAKAQTQETKNTQIGGTKEADKQKVEAEIKKSRGNCDGCSPREKYIHTRLSKIKDPTKEGDPHIDWTKGGRPKFYFKTPEGGRVPFDPKKYGGKKILNDATAAAYTIPRRKVLRDYYSKQYDKDKAQVDDLMSVISVYDAGMKDLAEEELNLGNDIGGGYKKMNEEQRKLYLNSISN